MFSLNNYVDALILVLMKEKDKRRRREILESWIKLLKKHHRILELEKIVAILESKIAEKENVSVTTASPEEAKILNDFFQSKGLKTESVIDPKVLGGARIVWDNLSIDNTLQLQLSNFKKRLT